MAGVVSSFQEMIRLAKGHPTKAGTELTTSELKSALRLADRSRARGNRDALIKEFMTAGGKLTHDETVARNRSVTN
jgi:hypothetical protein